MTTPTRMYVVPGMSCGHCRDAISSALAAVSGVQSVDVQLDTNEVHVGGAADEVAIRRVVEEAGYDVAGVR